MRSDTSRGPLNTGGPASQLRCACDAGDEEVPGTGLLCRITAQDSLLDRHAHFQVIYTSGLHASVFIHQAFMHQSLYISLPPRALPGTDT
jgi:hypothetical protein